MAAAGERDDGALVRLLETGDDPEQGRLADAVRPDETGPRVRAERETDLIENDLGAAVLRDAGELHSHRRTSENRGGAHTWRRRERERCRISPSWAGAGAPGAVYRGRGG